MNHAKEFTNIALDQDFAIPRIAMSLFEKGKEDQIVKSLSELGWKSFESPIPEIFANLVRHRDDIVIDIGANSGFYSLLSAAANPNLSILAFEPDPHVRALLEKNIAANKLGTQIKVFHLALSDRIGTGKLYIPNQDHGLVETSSSLESTFKDQHSEIIEISIATLDSVIGRLGDIPNQVNLIKIDVEGHEAAVIRGAENTIENSRPLIFIEVLPRADLKSINYFLENRRYKDIRFTPDGTTKVGNEVFFDPTSWNHLLVSAEKLDEILSLLFESRDVLLG